MSTKEIKKMVIESKKAASYPDLERIKKILDEVEQQKKSNELLKIEYWKAE